jgi:hypothetical protein
MRSGQESSGNVSICSLRPSPIVRGLLRIQRCVERGGLHTLPGVEPLAFAFWSSVNRAPPGRPAESRGNAESLVQTSTVQAQKPA